ncbi:MAG: zf-HC2 domain-containing protein [Candidatus Omnitrophica bacterium]|nr:zf-HC2 domain-containing protein [Candidatus Omnitrophota bacterium]
MDCSEVRKIIPEYVNHTITEDRTTEVEEHLCICNDCRQFLNNFIDNPSKSPTSKPTSCSEPASKKVFSFFDYIILAIGLGVFLFFIYLILRK